jgi:hypothetical protein
VKRPVSIQRRTVSSLTPSNAAASDIRKFVINQQSNPKMRKRQAKISVYAVSETLAIAGSIKLPR